tara:strand:+ start:1629 stop:1922 length:294 start_codon:yes stop_codon:yes gene_type:complete
MTIDDLNAINVIIDEFEGNTIMGKHIKKAVNAYFKQEKARIIVAPAKTIKVGKHAIFNKKLETMKSEADEALLRFNKKIRKQGEKNGRKKTAKKKNK